MPTTSPSWRNWAGNQTCQPDRIIHASTVEEIQQTVADAADRGQTVRTVGSGHSFTPLVTTDDVLLDVSGLSGLISVDRDRQTARMWAGTTIRDLVGPLWDAGFSLRNQGDIDGQTIAGAAATATHGSGVQLTGFSGALRAAEYVTADGAVHSMDASADRFGALRTAIGALGILTMVELSVAPAYELDERIEYRPLAEVQEHWGEESAGHRHFSYFWGPYDGSLELYGMDSAPAGMEQGCYVKIYDEAGGELPASTKGFRRAPAYEIYASEFDTPFDELEYFVPYTSTADAVAAVRATMLEFPAQRFPLEVRTIAAEDGWLSPMYGRASTSLSVSGMPGTDYWPFLRAVDAALQPFDPRPHWGKLNCFDRQRFQATYPRFDDFVDFRRELDPHGVFLNDYLRDLVG